MSTLHENTSMHHAEMVTINSPGHHLHNTSARVFYKHDDGRVNVQVTHSKKKGHVTNLTLKPNQFAKGVVNLDKQVKEDKEQLDEVGDTKRGQKLLRLVNKRAVDRVFSKRAEKDPAYAKKQQQTHWAADERLKEELKDILPPSQRSSARHRVSVTFSDPHHSMVTKRKEKQQKILRIHAQDQYGNSVYKGEAELAAKTHMKKQGYKVHEVNHIGLVSESEQGVVEGDVVQFPKKHKSDLDSFDDCPKCGRDLMGGKYMGHRVKVCNPCKQVYLPPNSGIDQKGNKIDESKSNAMANAAKRLTDPKDGVVAKLRAAGDKRREEQLKGRDIAKRDMKEQSVAEDNINELDKSTTQRYVDKATSDFGHQNMARRNTTGDQQKQYAHKEKNRQRGISRAIDRLHPQKEVQVNEIIMSPEDEKRGNQDYGKRATKLLKHSWAQHDVSREKAKAGDKEGADKAITTSSRAHKLFLKARDRHQDRETPEQRSARIERTMSGASDYYRSKKPGQYTGDSFDPTLTRDTPAIAEATSAAVRMQRALQRAKEERERRERLAQPFVDSVFGKKEKEMKKLSTIREEAEQKIHPNALHVKPVKVGGQTKYHVHAVGKNFSGGIKVGEHLSDSELDDFSEMGGKIKHVK